MDAIPPKEGDDDPDAGRARVTPNDGAPRRTFDSNALLGGQPQVAIRHNDAIYFLRATRYGKLILTK